jgi:hypothetical protein
MTIREREDELFSRWRPRHVRFAPDGLIDETVYLGRRPRVLFILKETNDWDEDLRDWLKDNDRKATWDVVARWAIGIHDRNAGWAEVENLTTARKLAALRGIAVMNLKKSPGGGSTKSRELAQAATTDADLLREQYRLYEPDLTVCGGSETAWLFRTRVLRNNSQASKTRNGLIYYREGDGVVVDFKHPQARGIQHQVLYDSLMNAIRQIQDEEGVGSPPHP